MEINSEVIYGPAVTDKVHSCPVPSSDFGGRIRSTIVMRGVDGRERQGRGTAAALDGHVVAKLDAFKVRPYPRTA